MKPLAGSAPQAVGTLGSATTMYHSRAPFTVLCENSIPGTHGAWSGHQWYPGIWCAEVSETK